MIPIYWIDSPHRNAGQVSAERPGRITSEHSSLGWVAAKTEKARLQFWLILLMHAEDLAVQESALPLFDQFTDSRTVDVACRHRDVIARFGRFLHRNAALGRVSSSEELGFLQAPGSRF